MCFLSPWSEFDFKPLGLGLVQTQVDLYYEDSEFGIIKVPKGFISDLASYPLLARPFFDRLGWSMRSAVLHDFPYRYHMVIVDEEFVDISRSESDRLLYDALGCDGEVEWRRKATWAGVRVGGLYAWHKNSGAGIGNKMMKLAREGKL